MHFHLNRILDTIEAIPHSCYDLVHETVEEWGAFLHLTSPNNDQSNQKHTTPTIAPLKPVDMDNLNKIPENQKGNISSNTSDHIQLVKHTNHSPVIDIHKTPDPFGEGELENLHLLLNDLLHNMGKSEHLDAQTKKALMERIKATLEKGRFSANGRKSNWKSVKKNAGKHHATELEEEVALSLNASEDDFPDINEAKSHHHALKDRKYWQRLVIAQQLREYGHPEQTIVRGQTK